MKNLVADRYESTRVRDSDYAIASELRKAAGLTMIDVIGICIETFAELPKKERDAQIAKRLSRRFAERAQAE